MGSAQRTVTRSARYDAAVALAVLMSLLWPGNPARPALEMSWNLARLASVVMPAALVDALASLFRSDVQVGAYAGPSYTMPSDVHLRQPNGTDLTLHDIHWRGEPFKMPPYYGYRAIYWPGGKSLGVMLDFTHIKAEAIEDRRVRLTGTLDGKPAPADMPLADIVQKLEFTHGYNLLILNAIYRRAPGSGRLRPYAGVGVGVSIPHVELFRAGWRNETRTNEYQIAGPAFQLLGGVEWQATAHTSIFLEYKISCSVNTGRLVRGGTLKTDLCSHQLLAGPAIHLRRHELR